MSKSETLYPQTLWDSEYEHLTLTIAPESDQIRKWLENSVRKYFKGKLDSSKPSCIEIGCFPGRYLAVMGRLGFVLNGIDTTPRVETDMKAWLKSQGYGIDNVLRGDFLNSKLNAGFDLVYSLGFIEHFQNWRELIAEHCRLVKPGGILLLLTPNFEDWFQNLFHRIFDRENFERHSIESMDPAAWKAIAESQGFQILECGYFDRLDFWIGCGKRNLFEKIAFWSIRALKPLLRLITPRNSRAFSPYCGLVAVKKDLAPGA